MNYVIEETTKNKISSFGNEMVEIDINDFNYLTNYSNERIIKIFLDENELLNFVKPTEELKEAIIDCIIYNKDEKELNDLIADQKLPLFSIIISSFKKLKKDYDRLCDINKAKTIVINCNKDNLIKGLKLAKKLDKKILINCPNISLHEYKEIFDKYNIEDLKNYDIKIKYQEENSPIKPINLYILSNKICSISDEIKKYNLSPVEQIMYAYDYTKNRKYKKDEENILNSRDLDKVIEGECIVCSGYSNLFNAILRCLNIKAMPILSYEKNHQRSIVYVQDEKYNIDGVYVFDPTIDRKITDQDDNYINKYNGFLIPYFKSHIEYPDKRFMAFDKDLEEIIKILKKDEFSVEDGNITDSLVLIYNFVDNKTITSFEDFIMKFDNEKRIEKEIRPSYQEVKSKYTDKELDMITFLQILYNTRRIEYCNEVVDTLDLSTIRRIIINKYSSIKLKEEKEYDDFMLFLKSIDYKINIDTYLDENEEVLYSNLPENTSVERDIVNMQLARTLRKINK